MSLATAARRGVTTREGPEPTARRRQLVEVLGDAEAAVARTLAIAFVGCDGSGKSTLSTDIRAEVAQGRSIELCHLGLGSGTMGERLKRRPSADTAQARKPDHGYELLRQKVGATPGLRFGGARIVDLDSREPYGVVRAAAARIVRGALGGAVPLR